MNDLLTSILNDSLHSLLLAGNNVSHPFRTGVIGTRSGPGMQMRTVILREVDLANHRFCFYTDIRSVKIKELSIDHHISWLFYDGLEKVQLRISGNAIIHHQDELTAEHWAKVSPAGRNLYRAMPGPSTVVDIATDGLTELSEANNSADMGFAHFALVFTQITSLEWLHLNRQGHRRAAFTLVNGKWDGNWLIP